MLDRIARGIYKGCFTVMRGDNGLIEMRGPYADVKSALALHDHSDSRTVSIVLAEITVTDVVRVVTTPDGD